MVPGENGFRVFDRAAGRDWFSGPAGAAVLFADPGDSWGSGITAWETVVGEFEVTRVEIMEAGPLKASLLMESRFRDCRVVQYVALYGDEPRLHCRVFLKPPRVRGVDMPTAPAKVWALVVLLLGWRNWQTR